MKIRNWENYINTRMSYQFLLDHKKSEDLVYWTSDEDNLKKISQNIDLDYELTPFQKHCMKQYVSYNEARKLYYQGFSWDWSDYIDTDAWYSSSEYYNYDLVKNYKEPRLHYKHTFYDYSDDVHEFEAQYSLRNRKKIDNYFKNHRTEYVYAPNCWTIIENLINEDKLTIIDNKDHIMFFYNDSKNFHLVRSSEIDVCFYKHNFDEAINIIFKNFKING